MSWEKIDESTYQYDEGGVRFFLLMGKKEALLIDSGMQTHNAKELVKELTDLHVMLFNTHTDVKRRAPKLGIEYLKNAAIDGVTARGYKGVYANHVLKDVPFDMRKAHRHHF